MIIARGVFMGSYGKSMCYQLLTFMYISNNIMATRLKDC